jgi:uncharacterized protein (TIGR00159 family)
MLGNRYRANKKLSFDNLFSDHFNSVSESGLRAIVDSCQDMSQARTGALIVISRGSELREFIQTGEVIDAEITAELLKSIFFKNAPLHDGAVIIGSNRIKAARCILPVSQSQEITPSFGLRHRAAIGLTEQTDALTIVVSEETGKISVSENGKLKEDISADDLFKMLELSPN